MTAEQLAKVPEWFVRFLDMVVALNLKWVIVGDTYIRTRDKIRLRMDPTPYEPKKTREYKRCCPMQALTKESDCEQYMRATIEALGLPIKSRREMADIITVMDYDDKYGNYADNQRKSAMRLYAVERLMPDRRYRIQPDWIKGD